MRKILSGACAMAMIACMASCSGRTQENMVPDGDTVEVAGGIDTAVTAGVETPCPAAQDSGSAQ